MPCPGGAGGGCAIGLETASPASGPPRYYAKDHARSCLESRVPSTPRLGGEALQKWTHELISSCFARDGSGLQETQSHALPFHFALHQGSGLPLELAYFCTDFCPDNGHVFARFVDVPEGSCRSRGGVPAANNGWGIYEGCVPPELSER